MKVVKWIQSTPEYKVTFNEARLPNWVWLFLAPLRPEPWVCECSCRFSCVVPDLIKALSPSETHVAKITPQAKHHKLRQLSVSLSSSLFFLHFLYPLLFACQTSSHLASAKLSKIAVPVHHPKPARRPIISLSFSQYDSLIRPLARRVVAQRAKTFPNIVHVVNH